MEHQWPIFVEMVAVPDLWVTLDGGVLFSDVDMLGIQRTMCGCLVYCRPPIFLADVIVCWSKC